MNHQNRGEWIQGGPDGKFNVFIGFDPVGDSSTQFSAGDSITFTITGISGLIAQDFNQLSTSCAGGTGQYIPAADISDGDGSGWVNPGSTVSPNDQRSPSVPDDSETIFLVGASLIAIWFWRWQGLGRSSAS